MISSETVAPPASGACQASARRTLLALTYVPTDTCQIDEVDFASPRMVGRTAEPNARIGPIQALLRNAVPPPVQVIDVEPNHELGTSVPKSGVAVALPPFLESKVSEQSPTGFIILPAWYERKQRIGYEIFHGSACNYGDWLADA